MARVEVARLLYGVCPLKLKSGNPKIRAVLEHCTWDEGLVFRLVLWAVDPQSPSTYILDIKEETIEGKYFPDGVGDWDGLNEFIAAWAEEAASRTLVHPDVALPRDLFHNWREPLSRVFQKRPENRRAALRTWFKNHKSFRE